MSRGNENSTVEEILPIRICFRIDSENNWNELNDTYYSVDGPPENGIPTKGEFGISVGQETIIIYMGINETVSWYDSFCVYNGRKNINFNPLYCFNEEETNQEENTTIIWNTEKQIFEKNLNLIGFLPVNDGVLSWDNNETRGFLKLEYRRIGSEIDSGIYNTNLVPPSFAGQSLSFAEQI